MRVSALTLRDFRNYERAELRPAEGLTVVVGPNGAGKTNLLEALYFGCTGRSPRTATGRELVRRGARVTRVTVSTIDDEGTSHLLEAGLAPGEPRLMRVDGAPVDNLSATGARPLVSVFLPDRLELVKGAPASRRAHLDQLVAALWPARVETRAAFSRALAQRNGLIARVRAGLASTASLGSWDLELARHGWRLMADRHDAIALLAAPFRSRAAELGLPEPATLRYRPRSSARSAKELAAELTERRAADLERGFTAHGPHRDELQLMHGEAALRTYGSQGQQRVALLALLFAERDVLAAERGRPPLMLLDDVMSELDGLRRELLSDLLRSSGQALVTSTDVDHVPGARGADVQVVEASGGILRPSEVAA